jgi:hypothetical protein
LRKDAPDVAAVTHVLTSNEGADTDHVTGCGDVDAGIEADCDVLVTGDIASECVNTKRRVERPGFVKTEGQPLLAVLPTPVVLKSRASTPTAVIRNLWCWN